MPRKKKRAPRRKSIVGRVPGVSVPSTPKSRAASRVNAFKHGGRAEVVSMMDVQRERMRKIHKDAPEIMQGFADQLATGDSSGVDAVLVAAMTETEIVRREAFTRIREEGVLVNDHLVNSEGISIGTRRKANPALEHARWLSEHVGATADQMRLSRKSGGEGAVNDALAKRLARDAMLRGADPAGLPAPAPRRELPAAPAPIDAELVER